MSVIQVFATTNMTELKEKEEFYPLLSDTLEKERGYYQIIKEDFNSKIGSESNYLETVGNFSSGEITNENGELLAEFAKENRLKITNTFYKKRTSKK